MSTRQRKFHLARSEGTNDGSDEDARYNGEHVDESKWEDSASKAKAEMAEIRGSPKLSNKPKKHNNNNSNKNRRVETSEHQFLNC